MDRPRIFISHSSKDPVALAFRDELVRRLRAAEYPVLLDEDIELNQYWRSTINTWIGGCDAAVLLLSEAALKSPYVAYEAALLSYRHASEQQRFKLVSVFLPPVTEELVKASPLGPACISEIQAVRQNEPQEEALQRVIGYLDQHVPSPESLGEHHAQRLREILEPLKLTDLKQAAREVGENPGPWTPGLELPMKVALMLRAAGLKRASKGVRVFRKHLENLDETMTLIATSWVDCRSVAEIPAVAKRQGLLALNGEDPRTAWLYVVGACRISPGDAWRVAQVDGVVGNKGIEDLKARVLTELARKFNVASTPEAVQNVVQKITSRGEPVFVALPLGGMNAKMLEALRTDFPTVTFFFLTGSNTPSAEQAKKEGIELLQPLLQPGIEQPFWQLYDEELDYLKIP